MLFHGVRFLSPSSRIGNGEYRKASLLIFSANCFLSMVTRNIAVYQSYMTFGNANPNVRTLTTTFRTNLIL